MDPSPTYRATTQQSGLPYPGDYLRLRPLQPNRHTETNKYGPNERTHQAPKIELSNEEIANLSEAEFKALVIRMLSEMVEYGRKIEDNVKAMQSERKENVLGTNSDRKQTRTQIWTRS